jgi:hypothetical protein
MLNLSGLKKFFYGKGLHENMFLYILYISWIIYFISLIGTVKFGVQYLDSFREVLKIYVAIFLITKFNPYQKEKMMTKFDKQIAFHAGIFLFSTTILNGLVEHYLTYTRRSVTNLFGSFY